MIARSESWRKKADSKEAIQLFWKVAKFDFDRKVGFFNFAKFQYAPRCHRPALRLLLR